MQAIVDPSEVRAFANQLEGNLREVRSRLRTVDGEFHQLNAVWKDVKYDVFGKIFEESKDVLEEFISRSENYAEHLRHRARILDPYFDNRY
jgi:hypothetical protein